MPSKFIRQYTLTMNTAFGDSLTIKDPFTVEFNITRQNLASLNTATFTVYNLAEKTRAKIFKDIYDTNTILPIEFYAGYQYGVNNTTSFMARCFKGQIKQAYSLREGSNYKTIIECWDGGNVAANGFVSQSIGPKTNLKSVIVGLVDAMKGVTGATVSDQFNVENKRGLVLFGNPLEMANQLTNNKFYIDNQSAFALKDNDAILGYLNTIDSNLGIINTPRRTGTTVEVSMIFEPRFIPSQEVVLSASTEKIYNGQYKVTGFTHEGIISQQVGGDCLTKVILSSLEIQNIIKTNLSNYYGLK